MNPVNRAKNRLRKEFIRNNFIAKDDQLDRLTLKILKYISLSKVSNIGIFSPIRHEPNIDWSKFSNYQLYLPVIADEVLNYYPYNINDQLVTNHLGILEPKTDNKTAIVPDLIIVPGLLFDQNGFRLGYGKGYYDRFLSHFRKKKLSCQAIGICFHQQIVSNLPTNSFDQRLDYIITD